MSVTMQGIQGLISAWSVDFYGGWSVMDIVGLLIVLTFTLNVINYYYNKASA